MCLRARGGARLRLARVHTACPGLRVRSRLVLRHFAVVDHEGFYSTIALLIPIFLVAAFLQERSRYRSELAAGKPSGAWYVLAALFTLPAVEMAAIFALATDLDNANLRATLLILTGVSVAMAFSGTINDVVTIATANWSSPGRARAVVLGIYFGLVSGALVVLALAVVFRG